MTLFDKCKICGNKIGLIECPTGNWWAHEKHPIDEHDAIPEKEHENDLE